MSKEKYSLDELREIFRCGLHTVAGFLGMDVSKISRDTYRDVCQEKGIKYVDPYKIGGFSKVRSEMIAKGEFDDLGDIQSDDDMRLMLEEMLYSYVKEHEFIPHHREFNKTFGQSVTKFFPSMVDFYEQTKERFPDIENHVLNETYYTQVYKECLLQNIKNHNRFVITSAVCGKKVDEGFFNSLKTYARKNKAMVIVLPIVNKNKASLHSWDLDPKLKEFNILFEEVCLNSNLRLWDIRINSKQTMCLTGLDRVTSTLDASIIVGSTKQNLKYIPTSKRKVPHMLASTGCCTVNDYSTLGLMPNRATKIAEVTHKIGALVVEVENEKIFHCRNIEAGPSGEIIDLSVLYSPDGRTEKVHNVVEVVGDLHVPKHNAKLVEKHLKLINKLNVSIVVLHDTINMGCVSHHNEGKVCLKAAQAMRGENTIEGEAMELKKVLESFCSKVDNVVIPYSNHPDHLNQYLEQAKFVTDFANFYISLELAKAMMDGENVLQYLMNKIGLKANNIKWLDQDDECSIYGVQAGYHGSEKCNGGKASPLTFVKGLGKIILAHSHSPSIIENAFVVGMACDKDQGYNKGLSSWLETSALLYPNGTVQLINFILIDDDYEVGL